MVNVELRNICKERTELKAETNQNYQYYSAKDNGAERIKRYFTWHLQQKRQN